MDEIAAAAQAIPDAEDGPYLQLPAVLDLKAAGALAAALLSRRGADIVLDAGSVQRLGGQCLQILLSAQTAWAEDGQSMSFENATPEFCAAVEMFGAAALSPDRKEPSL